MAKMLIHRSQITGGTKGIGASTASAAVRAGAKVALNYSRDSSQADKFVSELGSDDAFAIQADAGSIAGAKKMVEETVKRYGRIDVLILNAGIMPMKTLETTTEEDFDNIFALNVKGPYFLVQKALPHMAAGSRVIFVSTSVIHASHVSAPYTLYASTKGAIEQMTHTLSKDLGSKGITVNAVAPGPTGTDLFLKGKSKELIQSIAGFSPFGKLGEPAEIADVFIFLASEASRWISGQVILVNGAFAFQ
jgi:3-oxoacyl-[acyl-carrier protein] reductase